MAPAAWAPPAPATPGRTAPTGPPTARPEIDRAREHPKGRRPRAVGGALALAAGGGRLQLDPDRAAESRLGRRGADLPRRVQRLPRLDRPHHRQRVPLRFL